jgi:hypothetical protein
MTIPHDDPDGRWLAKQREIERLERELADRREHGSEEEIAELEHGLADLRVRGVKGVPIEDVLDVATFPGIGSWSMWRDWWTESGPATRIAIVVAVPLTLLGVYSAAEGLWLACAFAVLGLVSGAVLIDDRLGTVARPSGLQRQQIGVGAATSLAFFGIAWPLDWVHYSDGVASAAP